MRSRRSGAVFHQAEVPNGVCGRPVAECGLLYHLENPIAALRNMAAVCDEFLLIETIICDHSLPVLLLDDETKTYSQGLRGLGCRPTARVTW